MANTQALMEFHDKGYAGNIYEYGVKRESVTHWGNTNYYSYDGRGSVSDIIDGNGEVQMYHSYEPDGQTTLRFRSYVKNPYRYNAERVDYIPGIADFQYLRARYYTPDTARFIQQDTVWGKIDVPLSQNLYAYCGNNPVNFVDPSGQSREEAVKYYEDLIRREANSYIELEKTYQSINSLSEKTAVYDSIKQNKKDIASYEQALSKLIGNPVTDSVVMAKEETMRADCDDFASVLFKLNGAVLMVQNDGGTSYNVSFNMPCEHLEALVRMANVKNVDPTIILSIIAHESGFKQNEVNPTIIVGQGRAQGYMQVMPKYYYDSLNQSEYSEIKDIAYEYGGDDINSNMLNPYGNIAAGINQLSQWRKIGGEQDMLKSMRQGYKNLERYPTSDGWSPKAILNCKEFLDIKSQFDKYLEGK